MSIGTMFIAAAIASLSAFYITRNPETGLNTWLWCCLGITGVILYQMPPLDAEPEPARPIVQSRCLTSTDLSLWQAENDLLEMHVMLEEIRKDLQTITAYLEPVQDAASPKPQ